MKTREIGGQRHTGRMREQQPIHTPLSKSRGLEISREASYTRRMRHFTRDYNRAWQHLNFVNLPESVSIRVHANLAVFIRQLYIIGIVKMCIYS